MDKIMVFLNPYPNNNEETLGMIKSDETIKTPISRIDITIATVAKVINKIFTKITSSFQQQVIWTGFIN